MEASGKGYELSFSPVGAPTPEQFERCLKTFSTAVREKHSIQARLFPEHFRKFNLWLLRKQVRKVNILSGLCLKGV